MERLSSVGCKDFLSASTVESPVLPGFCLFVTRSSSYDALIFCALCIGYVLFNRAVLGSFLLDFIYGDKYSCMKECDKNTFRLRHVGIVARTASFLLILKPTIMVAFANKNWFDPYSQGSDLSLGDTAFISVMITSAFHLFELIFDQTLKPLLVLHHLGSIFIIQGFLPAAIGLRQSNYLELNGALAMMNVALYWALLDAPLVVLSYIAAVLRSTFIQGRTNIRKLFYVCFNAAAIFTFIEIVAIVYLSWQNWQQLSMLQRTIICSLQLLFTSAKARVCKSFYMAYVRQMDQLNNTQVTRHIEVTKPE